MGCILYYELANEVTRKLQKICLYVLSGPIMWVIILTRTIVKYTIVLLWNGIGNWLTKK